MKPLAYQILINLVNTFSTSTSNNHRDVEALKIDRLISINLILLISMVFISVLMMIYSCQSNN